MDRDHLLVADVGGTNCRLLLFEVDATAQPVTAARGTKSPGKQVLSITYRNEQHPSLIHIVRAFLKETKIRAPPIAACFAVAGPVKHNTVTFTNRKEWNISGEEIAAALGIHSVKLVNDFVAMGYGLLTLDMNNEEDCIVVRAGVADGGPIACVGAGTGLGECYLCPLNDTGDYACFASEGGHSDFAVRDDTEYGMHKFIKNKFNEPNRISVERVVSGSGLVNIYEYFESVYPHLAEDAVTELLEKAGDLKGAVIAKHQNNGLCKMALSELVRSYGAEVGVAALKWLPTGGLFLAGGLTSKNIDLIRDPSGAFIAAFLDKGRLSSTVASIPLYAVVEDNVGLKGAQYCAYKDYCKVKDSNVAKKRKPSILLQSAALAAMLVLGIIVGRALRSKR